MSKFTIELNEILNNQYFYEKDENPKQKQFHTRRYSEVKLMFYENKLKKNAKKNYFKKKYQGK